MDEQINPIPAQNPPQTPVETIPFYNPSTTPVQTEQTVPAPTQPTVNVTVEAPQVIEKIVYQKQKVHGFFRTLTIITLIVIGFLMLAESYGILNLFRGEFALDNVYPLFILFGAVVIRSYKGLFGKIFGLLMFLSVVGGFFTINLYGSLNPSTKSKFGDYINYMTPARSNTGVKLSKINLSSLIGSLQIKGKATDNLIEGNYKSDRNLNVSSGVMKNYDYLNLNEDTNRNILQSFSTNFDLGINNKRTTDIYVKNLLGINDIDLTDIRSFKTKIYGGIQDLTVTLGNNIFTGSELDIQLAGGYITLNIPKNLGVELYFKQLGGSMEITDFDMKGTNIYQSRNISVAEKVIKININSGISKFKINRK